VSRPIGRCLRNASSGTVERREKVGKMSGLASAVHVILGAASQMKDGRARPRIGAGEAPPRNAPELPTGKAFVLQLSHDTGPTLQPFAGRVEHLATGRRVRFSTFEDFRAAVIRLLSEAKQR
jgi:hypothetical protein